MKKNLVLTLFLLLTVLVGCKPQAVIPLNPSELTAVLESSMQILLNWKDNSDIETEFRVYRGVNTDQCTELLSKVGAGVTTLKDTAVERGKTYYYVVKAYNTAGESPASNRVAVTVPVLNNTPNGPTNLQATAKSETSIELKWQDMSDNETGFRVFRGVSSLAVTTLVKEVGVGVTKYVDQGLAPDTTYYYLVKAYNAAGESLESNQVQVKTPKAPTVPTAPTNLQAKALSTYQIQLTWEDTSSDEESFVVYRGITNTNLEQAITTLASNTTTFTDSGLDEDTTYYYLVRACNGVGLSEASNIVQGKTLPIKATLIAKIVDRQHAAIPGMQITLGTHKATTDENGIATFTEMEPGVYSMRGSGGLHHHYLLSTVEITLAKGIQENELTAMQVIGVGTVIQSYANMTNSRNANKLTALKKEMDLSQIRRGTPTLSSRWKTNRMSTRSLDLTQNVSFIMLQWEPASENTSYRIDMWKDGQWENVWSSDWDHPEDPAFEPANPQAYLDLGSELAGLVTGAGEYTFKILSQGVNQLAFPEVTVSLGMRLNDLPGNLTYANSQLSWSKVLGASQYRNRIYNQEGVLISNTTQAAEATSMIVPDVLTPGEYYQWYVDAQAFDETGWVAEITRGVSGFIR